MPGCEGRRSGTSTLPLTQVPLLALGPFRPRHAADPAAELDRLARLREKLARRARSLAPGPARGRDGRRLLGDLERTLTARADRCGRPGDGGLRFRARAVRGQDQLRRGIPGRACRRTPKVIRSVRDWAPSRSTWSGSSCSRASPQEELIRRAEDACRDQPRRPDRRQRPPGRCARAGTRFTWSGPAPSPRRSSRATTWRTGLVDADHELGRQRAVRATLTDTRPSPDEPPARRTP